MGLLFLGIVLLVIIGLLALSRPLYQAILGGLTVTALLWKMPPAAWLRQTAAVYYN